MKQITIAGGITRDAETRQAGQSEVTSFSVAVDHRDGQNKSTMYFDCSMWGRRGEALRSYLTKGSKVCVTGDLGTREHNGKTYLQVRVDNVTLQGGRPQQSGGGNQGGYGQQQGGYGGAPAGGIDDDSIPF